MKAIRAFFWSLREKQSHVLECVEQCWSRVRGKVDGWVQKRLSRGAQVFCQTFYLYMRQGLRCDTCHFLQEHTHTHKDRLKIERMVWSFTCTLLTLHTPCTPEPNTPCKRPPIFQRQPHVWHCMYDDHHQKQQIENEKTRGGFRSLSTHRLAHHLPDAPNTDYLAYEIMSQHFHIWWDKQTIQGFWQYSIW